MSEFRITVFGLGYIGLPTAALIASKRIPVRGVDTQPQIVEKINRGEVHIIEPDLEGLVRSVVDRKFLTAHLTPQEAEVYIVAVPTPVTEGHAPDMRSVEAVIDTVAPMLRPDDLVIIESTSPVGTTEKMYARILALRPDLKDTLMMAYCPERVLPGNVLYELEHNDRVVGGIDSRSAGAAKRIYQKFVKGKIHETTAAIAEMCKLTENAYRDVNIAFANELSMICGKAQINVHELINLANFHPRVNILKPGVGVGGHCIAVDPWFIISAFPELTPMMRNARETNDGKRDWVIGQIHSAAEKFKSEAGRSAVIACMGLAYKPDIDDLRESPALYITRQLILQGYEILPVEPHILEHADLTLVSAEEALNRADIVVYLVRHNAFTSLPVAGNEIDLCGLRNAS
jgi:UDP-N-acetyl-D-mannosaminuronic acid dehydrogenase